MEWRRGVGEDDGRVDEAREGAAMPDVGGQSNVPNAREVEGPRGDIRIPIPSDNEQHYRVYAVTASSWRNTNRKSVVSRISEIIVNTGFSIEIQYMKQASQKTQTARGNCETLTRDTPRALSMSAYMR